MAKRKPKKASWFNIYDYSADALTELRQVGADLWSKGMYGESDSAQHATDQLQYALKERGIACSCLTRPTSRGPKIVCKCSSTRQRPARGGLKLKTYTPKSRRKR